MKRTIQKALEIPIIVTLIFSLAACSSTIQPSKATALKNSSKAAMLTLWHQWVVEDDQSITSLNNAVNEWNKKNPDKEIQAVGVNTEQYKIKIKSALAAGDAPDIFYMWGGSFSSPYIRSGNILALDPYLEDGTKDKLIPGTLEGCTFGGKIYSLPMFTFIANLYCNKDLFERVGAKIPTTYDELMKAARSLRSAGITPITVGEKDRWPGMYWFDILAMREMGNQACMDALDNPSLFDQPGFLAATEKLVEMINAQAFNDDALSTGFDDMLDDFKAGEAAMIYQGNWVDTVIEGIDSDVKNKIISVPFPVIKDGNGAAGEFLGGNADGFYINVNTKHKEDAVEALKFISEKASKEGYLNGAGLPCWKMEGEDDSKVLPLAKRSAGLMNSGTSFVSWWDTILPAADSDVHKDLIAELFAGKMTAQEFLSEMTKMEGISDIKPYQPY